MPCDISMSGSRIAFVEQFALCSRNFFIIEIEKKGRYYAIITNVLKREGVCKCDGILVESRFLQAISCSPDRSQVCSVSGMLQLSFYQMPFHKIQKCIWYPFLQPFANTMLATAHCMNKAFINFETTGCKIVWLFEKMAYAVKKKIDGYLIGFTTIAGSRRKIWNIANFECLW